jgi:hypothetical protein
MYFRVNQELNCKGLVLPPDIIVKFISTTKGWKYSFYDTNGASKSINIWNGTNKTRLYITGNALELLFRFLQPPTIERLDSLPNINININLTTSPDLNSQISSVLNTDSSSVSNTDSNTDSSSVSNTDSNTDSHGITRYFFDLDSSKTYEMCLRPIDTAILYEYKCLCEMICNYRCCCQITKCISKGRQSCEDYFYPGAEYYPEDKCYYINKPPRIVHDTYASPSPSPSPILNPSLIINSGLDLVFKRKKNSWIPKNIVI